MDGKARARLRQLNVRLPEPMVEAVREKAKASGIPIQAIVREALQMYFARELRKCPKETPIRVSLSHIAMTGVAAIGKPRRS